MHIPLVPHLHLYKMLMGDILTLCLHVDPSMCDYRMFQLFVPETMSESKVRTFFDQKRQLSPKNSICWSAIKLKCSLNFSTLELSTRPSWTVSSLSLQPKMYSLTAVTGNCLSLRYCSAFCWRWRKHVNWEAWGRCSIYILYVHSPHLYQQLGLQQ